MSELKKYLCRPVEFRGPGPYWIHMLYTGSVTGQAGADSEVAKYRFYVKMVSP